MAYSTQLYWILFGTFVGTHYWYFCWYSLLALLLVLIIGTSKKASAQVTVQLVNLF